MTSDHGFPIVRIEIEGMKQSIVHAIMERQLLMDEWVVEEVERQCSDENIKISIQREVQRAIDASVRESVDRFYRLGEGRKIVSNMVESRLRPRVAEDCIHFHTVNHTDNPRRFECLDCGRAYVDLGQGYEVEGGGS